jgi:hypothetical protein
MECFVWLVLRTEYEAMGLQVLEHEADEDSRAWTDPPIRMQDGREYVYLYPDNVMDLLRSPRGEPARLRITKLVTGNKGTGQSAMTSEAESIKRSATAPMPCGSAPDSPPEKDLTGVKETLIRTATAMILTAYDAGKYEGREMKALFYTMFDMIDEDMTTRLKAEAG